MWNQSATVDFHGGRNRSSKATRPPVQNRCHLESCRICISLAGRISSRSKSRYLGAFGTSLGTLCYSTANRGKSEVASVLGRISRDVQSAAILPSAQSNEKDGRQCFPDLPR